MNKFHSFLHHLLIPKESNNYRAKAIHLDFLTVYLIIALFFTAAVKQLQGGDILGFATDVTVDKVFALTNQQRVNGGLPPLQYNAQLSAAAQNKAAHMFQHGYWAHFGGGSSPWEFILASGYKYELAGENLGKEFQFSDGLVNAWMNSPTHRDNIMRNNYTDMGIAVVNGNLAGQDTTLVVQMFGKPLGGPSIAEQNNPLVKQVAAEQTQAKPAQIQPTIPQQTEEEKKLAQVAKNLPKTELVTSETQPKINLFPVYFNMNIVFLIFLSSALLLDFYLTRRMNIARISGKNLAHFIFVGFILISLFIIRNGAIL